jgi:hypothetical protein
MATHGPGTVPYQDVFQHLDRCSIRFVVIGGMALVLHGSSRPTSDLDVMVDPAPDEANRAMSALSSLGFQPTIPLPLWQVVVLKLLDRDGRGIDAFCRAAVPFGALWSSSELAQNGETRVRIASLPHLCRLKRSRGSPRDLCEAEEIARFAASQAQS